MQGSESEGEPLEQLADTAPYMANEPEGLVASSVGSDWEEPRRLHPSSVIFEAISKIREYIFPAIVGLFSATQGGWGIWIAGIVFGGSILATLLRYFTLRYRIQDGEFVIKEGLLFRRTRSVPIRKIQNVDLVQNVLHRVFGVAEVKVETASGTEAEATLRVLTKPQIEELRAAVLDVHADEVAPDELLSGEDTLSEELSATSQSLSSQLLHTISTKTLIQAGVCSNRGAVFIGVIFGFFFQGQFWEGWQPGAGRNFWRKYIPSTNWLPDWIDTSWFSGWAGITLLCVVLFFLLRLLGMIWYVHRFYGYQLEQVGNDFRISCGLLTRVSATVPRNRIQFISVHRPLLLRWMGLASIRIETAGGAGVENENASTTVSRRWFVPVLREEEVDELLAKLRPGMNWLECKPEMVWHGVSPLTEKRLRRKAIIFGVIATAVGLAITRPWGWIAGPVLVPILLWLAYKKSRAKRFGRAYWGVVYQSGFLMRKMSFAFFDRIQGFNLAQSPFDRRWNMATLQVDTAAAGPAEHTIDIAYLDQDFAMQQFGELQRDAAKQRPSWA